MIGKERDLNYAIMAADMLRPALNLFASLISLAIYIALISQHDACLFRTWGNLERNEHSKNPFRTTQPSKIALVWWRKLI